MADDPLRRWQERLQLGLDMLRHPNRFLAEPPPAGGDPEQTLALLEAVRQALEVDDGSPRPAAAAAGLLVSRHMGSGSREYVAELVTTAAHALDARIAGALDALAAQGKHSARWLRTADFGPDGIGRLDVTATGLLTPAADGSGRILYVGLPSALPESHPLSSLPEDDLFHYQQAGQRTTPALVLGLPQHAIVGLAPPRPFYSVASVRHLTGLLRGRQRAREEEAVEQLRREAAAERQAWSNSPLGELARKQAALARLRAQGQIDDTGALVLPDVPARR